MLLLWLRRLHCGTNTKDHYKAPAQKFVFLRYQTKISYKIFTFNAPFGGTPGHTIVWYCMALIRPPPHCGWTPFCFMYDPECSTTFPWCTIDAPATFAWCTIHAPAAFAWCTNHFVHKVEFSYTRRNGVHPLCSWGPFYQHGLTLIPAWISNYIHYKVWDEITDK